MRFRIDRDRTDQSIVCANDLWEARMSHVKRGGTAAVAAALLLAGCTQTVTGGGSPSQSSTPTNSASHLDWQPCPTDPAPTKQCATLGVPFDYARPDVGTFQLAVARIPAEGPADQRIGSLFWDAGGPGGPGVASMDSFLTRLSASVKSRFDLVSWDPRGIGETTPALVDCDQPWPARPARVAAPNWARVQTAYSKQLSEANTRCQAANQSFINYMGTNKVVQDLDRLREAVGDQKLTFWATSYGTRIGYVFAMRYPDRVRAILMDGNIDPHGSYAGLSEGGVAPDDALRFMRRNYPSGYQTIMRTADALTARPLLLDDGRLFSRWNYLDLVQDNIWSQSNWPVYADTTARVLLARRNNPAGRAERANMAQAMDLPNSNAGGAFSVVNCLDYAERMTQSQQAAVVSANARSAPVFGGSLTLQYAAGCDGLDLQPDPVPLLGSARSRRIVAEIPVMLSNATADAMTPMLWALRMQQAFDRPMIKYRSGQHTVWEAVRSACVNDPINRFMLTSREPRPATCPFVPPTNSKGLP